MKRLDERLKVSKTTQEIGDKLALATRQMGDKVFACSTANFPFGMLLLILCALPACAIVHTLNLAAVLRFLSQLMANNGVRKGISLCNKALAHVKSVCFVVKFS